MDLVRWGIIGCGAVTEVKSGPGFQKAKGSALVAVMRRNAELAADYAKRHGVPKWYDDAEALVRDPDVDAIYVATPPGRHLEHALLACAAKKPTYVEKPMARSFAECRRMIAAFEEARVPLFVAYYRRALDRFRAVRDMVASGRLGSIEKVSYRFARPLAPNIETGPLPWRLSAADAGGGLFLDLGSHTLDILDFILGPLEKVEGEARNVAVRYEVEDYVALRFSTRSGARGDAEWNFAATDHADQIVISGAEGEVRLATFGDDPIEVRTAGGVERIALPNPKHIQQPLIETIVAELLGRGRCESTGPSAARTSAVMDAALEGYYGARDSEFWRSPAEWPGAPSAPRKVPPPLKK
jgi:1,5-anhydro-D-fructose reductase (1,5-anhydro-D-mannitol-forming)